MAKKNGGLGRGLDAIFLDNTREVETVHSEESIVRLRLSSIDPKSDQP